MSEWSEGDFSARSFLESLRVKLSKSSDSVCSSKTPSSVKTPWKFDSRRNGIKEPVEIFFKDGYKCFGIRYDKDIKLKNDDISKLSIGELEFIEIYGNQRTSPFGDPCPISLDTVLSRYKKKCRYKCQLNCHTKTFEAIMESASGTEFNISNSYFMKHIQFPRHESQIEPIRIHNIHWLHDYPLVGSINLRLLQIH